MKPQTITHLTFLPRTSLTPHEYTDHQILQAMFAAARAVTGIAGTQQTIGDPAVVIPADMYERVASTRWEADKPQTILERMLANNPGIDLRVQGQSDVEQQIERLTIDRDHYREAAEGMTAQRVRELEERLMIEQNAGAHELGLAREALAIEEGKVASLSAELARRLQQDAGQVTAAPPTDPAIAALDDFKARRADDLLQVRGIATDAALMVLDTLNPRAEGQPPHEVRVHMPGAGLLRVIVAADVTDDVLAELEAKVDDKVAERVTSLSIEREPGSLPEGQGYEIKEHVDGNGEGPTGVHPGSPATEEWMVYHWENAELDDAGQGRKSKAEAIDDVWVDYASTVDDSHGDGTE